MNADGLVLLGYFITAFCLGFCGAFIQRVFKQGMEHI